MTIRMVFYTLLMLSSFVAAAHGSKNKHQCPNRCGDVIIKSPFGVGSHCSKDANFALTCNGSSPILTKFNLEVIEIGEIHTIVVNTPIFKSCADDNKTLPKDSEIRFESSLDLSGSPFYIRDVDNAFVSVGCEGMATLYNETGGKVGGCSSTCGVTEQEAMKGCFGYKCCQWNVFGISKRFSVGMVVSKGSCRYAFLTSTSFVNANAAQASTLMIPSSGVVPLVLRFPYHGSKGLGVLLFVSCCFGLVWFYTTKKRRKEVKLRAKYFKGKLEQSLSDREIVEKTKLFSIKELKKSTENFSEDRILGHGGQGTVYKGMLTNGQVIAVKKSKAFDENQWKQFINEANNQFV